MSPHRAPGPGGPRLPPETQADPGADCISAPTPGTWKAGPGFLFQPAGDRRLLAWADAGALAPRARVERGPAPPGGGLPGHDRPGGRLEPRAGSSCPWRQGTAVTLSPAPTRTSRMPRRCATGLLRRVRRAPTPSAASCAGASGAFLARRGDGSTVIAGYPWFLDWGRDTFIAARGLLAGGMDAQVREILLHLRPVRGPRHPAQRPQRRLHRRPGHLRRPALVRPGGGGGRGRRTPASSRRTPAGGPWPRCWRAIAAGYRDGTPNGIRVDPASGLVWSPSHFTWMDTNYPAGTPREGYPVEIQALWIRLLRQLERLRPEAGWGSPGGPGHGLPGAVLGRAPGLLPGPAGRPRRAARPGRPARRPAAPQPGVPGEPGPGGRGPGPPRRWPPCARLPAGARRPAQPGAPAGAGAACPSAAPGARCSTIPVHPVLGPLRRGRGHPAQARLPQRHRLGLAAALLLRGPGPGLGVPARGGGRGQGLPGLPGRPAGRPAAWATCRRSWTGTRPTPQRGCDAQAWSATEALRVWLLLD